MAMLWIKSLHIVFIANGADGLFLLKRQLLALPQLV